MADIKISQLGSAISVADSDIVPVVSGGNTLKATAAQLKEHAIGNTSLSGIGDGSVTGAISTLNSDKQPKTLATPITVNGTQQTTVETALGAINTDLGSTKQALTNKVNVSDIANNLTTTTEGKVLDARQGKALEDSISDLESLNTVASITADKGYSNTIFVNVKKWGKVIVVSGWLLLDADTYTDAKPVLVIPNVRPWGQYHCNAISTGGTKVVRLYPLDRNSRTEMVLDGSPTLSEQLRFYFNMTYVCQ